MCGTILCNYKRFILWFDLLKRLVHWICSYVILIRITNILQFGWRMDRRSLEQNYNESLAMSLLEILCSSRSSCSSFVLHLWRFMVEVLRGFRGLNPLSFIDFWFVEVSGGFWAWFQWTLRSRQVVWMILLRMFFVFEDLWWKFFGALEAWIRRASPICCLLRFLEAFELDSSDLWDLGRWFGWFCFECSSILGLKFLKALRLDSCRAFVLLNPLLSLFLFLASL